MPHYILQLRSGSQYHAMSREHMTLCTPIATIEAMAPPRVFDMETTTMLYSLWASVTCKWWNNGFNTSVKCIIQLSKLPSTGHHNEQLTTFVLQLMFSQPTDAQSCRTGFDCESLTAAKNSDTNLLLLLEFTIEIMAIIPYMGVVFSFIGLLSLDLLSFLFLDYFEGNANISVAI